jgi:hypothetical protein
VTAISLFSILIGRTACGTCTLLTPTSGTIQSLNFPNDYGVYNSSDTFINCLYTIKAPPRRKIQLTFTTFVVEQKFDLINVSWISIFWFEKCDLCLVSFQGLWRNISVRDDSSGKSHRLFPPPAPFTTVETNQMSVVFNTDRNNAGLPFCLRPAKWQATFKVVPYCPNPNSASSFTANSQNSRAF